MEISQNFLIFFFNQFLVGLLQQYHKSKGHRTSGLLFLFWLSLFIGALPELFFVIDYLELDELNSWQNYHFISYIVYFSLISVMLILNCFADKEPRTSTYHKYNNPSPELRSSFLRQIFFQWFDKTVYYGWRRPLTEADMYDINPADASRELVPPFDKYFNESVEKGRR